VALTPFRDALSLVIERTPGPDAEAVRWSEAVGRVLAEPLRSLRDDPPFDRSSMDGFAVRSAEAVQGARLEVIEFLAAGDVPLRAVGSGQASKVMTGAPVPDGADAIVPVEDCEASEQVVTLREGAETGQHVRYRGENIRRGEPAFESGRSLDAADVGLGIMLGLTEARVVRRPGATILSTGSELVPPETEPGPGQIADSNGPMLAGLWESWGGTVDCTARVPDEEGALRSALAAGFESDFLLLCGGVSAGDLDLVPGVLASCGVEVLLHKVRVKPGKPLLFGVRGRTAVFGLPGNPVSTLVGALVFLHPAFAKRAGSPPTAWSDGALAEAWSGTNTRTCLEPARVRDGAVTLLPHKGSADLASWRWAEAVAELPAKTPIGARETVRYLPWRAFSEGKSRG
jgi:molybdopterin molybdotransferase